jgi:hypothetical protein
MHLKNRPDRNNSTIPYKYSQNVKKKGQAAWLLALQPSHPVPDRIYED